MSNNYGTVVFKGKTYNLLSDAWADNYGTNGEIVFKANAELDGTEYHVFWQTTEEYDLAGELAGLEAQLRESYRDKKDLEEIQERIDELEAEGVHSYLYTNDDSAACDWEHPWKVEA